MTDTKARAALESILRTMSAVEWPEDWHAEVALVRAALDRRDALEALLPDVRVVAEAVREWTSKPIPADSSLGAILTFLYAEKARGE
jgi:hypothetical protein